MESKSRLSSCSLARNQGEGQAMGLAAFMRPAGPAALGAERMTIRNSQPHLLDAARVRMPRRRAGKEQPGEADPVTTTASLLLRQGAALTTSPPACPRRVRR
jgi:hypothetical protein